MSTGIIRRMPFVDWHATARNGEEEVIWPEVGCDGDDIGESSSKVAQSLWAATCVIAGAVRESHKEIAPFTFSSYLNDSTQQELPDPSVEVSSVIYGRLCNLVEDDLAYGERMSRVEFLSELTKFPGFIAGIESALTSERISDEAKSAAVRYLGVYESHASNSELARFFLKQLKADSELLSIASARSLRGVCTERMIPVLKSAFKQAKHPEAREEISDLLSRLTSKNEAAPSATK